MKNRIIFTIEKDGCTLMFCLNFNYLNFSGKGCCYIDETELMKKLKAFECYPLKSDAKICIEGGYYNEGMNYLKETHLHLSFNPVDMRGGIEMKIITSTPSDECAPFSARSAINVEVDYEKIKEIVKSIRVAILYGESEVLL